MKSLIAFIKNQPVRFFALACVALTSAYIMWMGWRLSNILTSPGWCNRTLKAEQIISDGSFDALKACVGLLTLQLQATATNSHIYAGVIALCLLALMVIVVAGGHLSFQGPGGFGGSVGGNKDAAPLVTTTTVVNQPVPVEPLSTEEKS